MSDAAGGYYAAKRSGYHINSGSAWKNGSITYNESKRYKAQTICSSLATKNQSVTLKVNWIKNSTSSGSSSGGGSSCTWTTCTGIVSSGTMCIDGCGGSTNRCFCKYSCCK